MGWRLLQYNGAFDALMKECTDAMKRALRPKIAMVQLMGNQTKFPTTESLGGGLFEVRARADRVRIRVLFGFFPEKRIVVVWGGTKDQASLPPATIAAARKMLKEVEAQLEALDVINFN